MPTRRDSKNAPSLPVPQRSLQQLSDKRQDIIRPVLESPQEFVLLNVRDMARRLATAPTTIIRIVQALGFATYKDFQHYLHDLSVTSATILDSMQAAGNTAQPPRFLRDSRKQIQQNLEFVMDHVDLEQVLKTAARIHEANRILLLGGDMASSLISYMEYHLTIAGLPVVAAIAPGRCGRRIHGLCLTWTPAIPPTSILYRSPRSQTISSRFALSQQLEGGGFCLLTLTGNMAKGRNRESGTFAGSGAGFSTSNP